MTDLAWEAVGLMRLSPISQCQSTKVHYLHAKDIGKAGAIVWGIRHSQNVLADPNRSAAEKRNTLGDHS